MEQESVRDVFVVQDEDCKNGEGKLYVLLAVLGSDLMSLELDL
jgi:hypothetical protein